MNFISPFTWMLIATTGLYLAYLPFNCLYFERMIATYKINGNFGFVMYIADAFGYLGTVTVLLVKEFMPVKYSWPDFFSFLFYASAIIGSILIITSLNIHRKLVKSIWKKISNSNWRRHCRACYCKSIGIKRFTVKVFERNGQAVGASIRNFGMVWPIGQPSGTLYKRAMCSRQIWKDIAIDAGFWYEQTGSLHVAYTKKNGRCCRNWKLFLKQIKET